MFLSFLYYSLQLFLVFPITGIELQIIEHNKSKIIMTGAACLSLLITRLDDHSQNSKNSFKPKSVPEEFSKNIF